MLGIQKSRTQSMFYPQSRTLYETVANHLPVHQICFRGDTYEGTAQPRTATTFVINPAKVIGRLASVTGGALARLHTNWLTQLGLLLLLTTSCVFFALLESPSTPRTTAFTFSTKSCDLRRCTSFRLRPRGTRASDKTPSPDTDARRQTRCSAPSRIYSTMSL
jgi:hypothetical protein